MILVYHANFRPAVTAAYLNRTFGVWLHAWTFTLISAVMLEAHSLKPNLIPMHATVASMALCAFVHELHHLYHHHHHLSLRITIYLLFLNKEFHKFFIFANYINQFHKVRTLLDTPKNAL